MDSPSAFESISIQSLNSVVGELSTMRFTIDPFNPIYNGSTITIQSPSQVLFPTSPECTSTSPTITNLACSLINTDLQLTIAL